MNNTYIIGWVNLSKVTSLGENGIHLDDYIKAFSYEIIYIIGRLCIVTWS